MRLWWYWVSVTLLFTCSAQARFVVEQSALTIKFPISGRQAHPDGFDMSLANFGAPQYGGSLVYVHFYLLRDHSVFSGLTSNRFQQGQTSIRGPRPWSRLHLFTRVQICLF